MKDQIVRLFLHTEHQLFNQQAADGSGYKTIDVAKDDIPDYINRHVKGEHTLAIRLIQPRTNHVRAGCIDMDIEYGQPVGGLFEQAVNLQAGFKSYGLETYLEFSGSKGFHLWLFTASPLPAKTTRRAIFQVCKNIGFEPKEVFPKGDVITEDGKGAGYAPIKLPFGIHRKSNRRSFFIRSDYRHRDDDWPPDAAAATVEEVATYVQNDPAIIAKVAESYQEDQRAHKQADSQQFSGLSEGDHPACIRDLITHGAPADQEYNASNLTLARYCNARGISDIPAREVAGQMAKSTPATHPTSKSLEDRIKNFDSAWRSVKENPDNYPWSCGYIRCSPEMVGRGGCQGWDCPFSPVRGDESPFRASPTSDIRESDVIDFIQAKPEKALEQALQVMPPAEGFLNETNRAIWNLFSDVGTSGGEIRKSTLLSALEESDLSPDLKEKAINRLTVTPAEAVCSDETFQGHLIQIRNTGLKVQLSRCASSAIKELSDGETPVESTLDTLTAKTERLWAQSATEYRPMVEGLPDLLSDLIYNETQTVPTFAPRLDSLLNGGFGLGKFGVIASPPGGGKTTFLSQVADNAARTGIPVLYISYEMGDLQLLTYALARAGGINSGDIETRKWNRMVEADSKELQDKVAAAIRDYNDKIAPNVTIVEASDTTTASKIKGLVTKVRRKAGRADTDPVLVVIDYLQLMPCGEEKIDQGNNETLRVSRIATQLKQLARDTHASVLAISDINKAAYEEATKTGQLNMGALRDSFKIAHSADQVFLLQTSPIQVKSGQELQTKDQLQLYEDNFPANARMQRTIRDIRKNYPLDKSISAAYARLKLLKNRGGRCGETLFLYEKAYHRFVPLDLADFVDIPEENGNDPV